MTTTSRDASEAPSPGLIEIFLAFAGMAIMGFGGVLPWARRMLVEQRRWMTPDDFAEALSLCQFLPGGNVINLGILVGRRFAGMAGAVAAVAGMMAAPVIIVLALGALYLRYGQTPQVHGALDGVTAAAAGLILAMAGKMAAPLFRRGAAIPLLIAALVFVGVGLLELPLPAVLLVLAPLSIAFAWWKLR
jgi:chromate transporter